MLDALHEVCINLGAQPYAASCTPTHWHLLVGWGGEFGQPTRDRDRAPHVNAGLEDSQAHSPGLTSGAQSSGAQSLGAHEPETKSPDEQAKQLATRLKRIAGMKLSKHLGVAGTKWFLRGWDLTRVEDQRHFNHLAESYLPKHTSEAGLFQVWPIQKRV